MSDAETLQRGPSYPVIADEIERPLADVEAEFRLVGALINNRELFSATAGIIIADTFYERKFRQLYHNIEAGEVYDDLSLEVFFGVGEVAGLSGAAIVDHLHRMGADQDFNSVNDLAIHLADIHERRNMALGPPPPLTQFKSRMGLLLFADRNEVGATRYDFMVEDLIPERELVLVVGSTQTGKTFWTYGLTMALAAGKPFYGKRILTPRPVIWCAYEGALGARDRMKGYALHHGIEAELPFALLQRPLDLWTDEKNIDALAAEFNGISDTHFSGVRPGAIVIDTNNAATPGASEIDSEVVSKIRNRYRQLAAVMGCAIIIIGHTNALGKHRGNEQLVNNVDTVITITKKTSALPNRHAELIKDNDGREVRNVDVTKQREGRTGSLCDFVLVEVSTGEKDNFGKDRTTCVLGLPRFDETAEPSATAAPSGKSKEFKISDNDKQFFAAFWKARDENGEPPPGTLQLSRQLGNVVRWDFVRKFYFAEFTPPDVPIATARKRLERSTKYFMQSGMLRIIDDTRFGPNEKGEKQKLVYWTGKYHSALHQLKSYQPSKYDDMQQRFDMSKEPEFPE